MFKLNAFADDNFSVTQKRCSFFDRAENIVGEGENAGYLHFFFFFFHFPAMFSKAFFSRVIENQELFGKGLQKEQECKESELYKINF